MSLTRFLMFELSSSEAPQSKPKEPHRFLRHLSVRMPSGRYVVVSYSWDTTEESRFRALQSSAQAKEMSNSIIVTGGAGFIGSNFILQWTTSERSPVVNVDRLTYAGNPENLSSLQESPSYSFVRGDICDRPLLKEVLTQYRPCGVVHFAAESHVDRSILGPEEFVRTNVHGTFCLLEEVRQYWSGLHSSAKERFRFLHVSTDEVYGSLNEGDPPFDESTAYAPNSPYAASKASSDHLVRAYFHTYGLPVITTNCSNNYGPYQFPEKLIPLVILNALKRKPLPVYGDGSNIRDWLFVGDHCAAVRSALRYGRLGETYNVGGRSELRNIDVVRTICGVLDEYRPTFAPHEKLIQFVQDRPGHDRRYAIDPAKAERDLQWQARESFESGIRKTVSWYLSNQVWVEQVANPSYREWMDLQYGTPGEVSDGAKK
jgi:dTDP-glucose 4,6-dehydratase